MPYTVVFLWISAARAAGAPPARASREQAADLADFGAVRGLSFTRLPSADVARPGGLPSQDAALVDQLEAELEQARTALSALEEEAALQRLERIQTALLTHAHLPQAAFLMAECLRLQAQAAREGDLSVARELTTRSLALGGPRALAFGESPLPEGPPLSIPLQVDGLRETDELELDGVTLGPLRQVTVAPGLHHARVWRAGRLIFATFAEVGPEQMRLALPAPRLIPCSAEDLHPEGLVKRGAPHSGIECEHWALVREEAPGIGVALCQASSCGRFVHWQRRPPQAFAPIALERAGLPAWAGFAIAGATAVVATGLLLWQSGGLEQGQRRTATWQYGGLNPQGGVRF